MSLVTINNGPGFSSCVDLSTISASSSDSILMIAGFGSDSVTDINSNIDFKMSLEFFDLDAEDCDTNEAIDY